ncbi:hypothetical protein Dimus_037111 [Dionaea muscipula]
MSGFAQLGRKKIEKMKQESSESRFERCLRGEKEPNVPSLPDNWDQVMKIENMVCLFMDDPSVIKVYVADTLNLSLYHMVDFNYKHPVCTTFGVVACGTRIFVLGGIYDIPGGRHRLNRQGPKLLCPKPKPFVAALENRIYALTSSGHWYEHHFEVLDLNITGAGQEAHWEGLPGLDENAGDCPRSFAMDKEKRIMYFAFMVETPHFRKKCCQVYCFDLNTQTWIKNVVVGGSPSPGLQLVDHVSSTLAAGISRLALPSSCAPREVLLGKLFCFTDRSPYLWMIDSDSDSYSPIHEFSEGILGELAEIFDRYKLDDYYMPLGFVTRTSSDDDDGNLFLAVSLSCSLLDRKTPAEYAHTKHILCLASFRLVVKDDGGGYCISRLVKDEPRINFFRMEEQKGCDFDGYSRVYWSGNSGGNRRFRKDEEGNIRD